MIAGTPVFMPREQATNFKYVRPTGDVWSMGATFYNMLTGKFPRDFPHGRDMMQVMLQSPVVPIRRRDSNIPPRLAEVIDRALAEKPQDRYQDAGEMLKALKVVL
jgi:serine/threonine protein kinase